MKLSKECSNISNSQKYNAVNLSVLQFSHAVYDRVCFTNNEIQKKETVIKYSLPDISIYSGLH